MRQATELARTALQAMWAPCNIVQGSRPRNGACQPQSFRAVVPIRMHGDEYGFSKSSPRFVG